MKDTQKEISSEYSMAIKGEKRGAVSGTANAKFADYSAEELENLPEGMGETSFGCGNPLAFSDVKPGQVVLDLGCGAGLDLLLAADRVGESGRVIGIDINEDMLERARKNIQASGFDNIELRRGAVEALPVDSGTVDWIISNCVINLSVDKQKAFSEIGRVLKPGGRMLISDMVAEDLPWWVTRSGVLTAACGGGVISENEYVSGLKQVGIDDCTVIARQYYDPSQLASVVDETLPTFIKRIRCCGKAVSSTLLTKLATPISRNLWSAKFAGSNSRAERVSLQ